MAPERTAWEKLHAAEFISKMYNQKAKTELNIIPKLHQIDTKYVAEFINEM